MGSCLSKKSTICSSPSALPDPSVQSRVNPQVAGKRGAEEETLKKEIFVIKHRRSHDIDRRSEEEKSTSDQKISAADVSNGTNSSGGFSNGGIAVRGTSSCTKEEVDAILIQCGRLSRSSSTRKVAAAVGDNEGSARRGWKYSGSKRSYDFDQETSNSDRDKKKGVGFEDGSHGDDDADAIDGGDDETAAERIRRHRQRQNWRSSSRRRTPSRERDQSPLQQHRSGSRERNGSGGRRVSRSPGRRSESPITRAAAPLTSNSSGINPSRPGKMVSVPATVSSLAMDKTNNGTAADPPSAAAAAAIKRISVKRNAGDPAMVCPSAALPRSRSPARANLRASNDNQNPHSNGQPLSLSRSNSRKAERSPHRRNALNEIDQNCMGFEPSLPTNKSSNNVPSQKPNVENGRTKVTAQGTLENKDWSISCRAKDRQMDEEDGEGLPPMESESLKPHKMTRSRSSRLSRDLEFNPETLLPNPSPSSYTAQLLEDIQNFHQKSSAPAISLPPCVTKACSILEAVADLNSSSSFNLPDDRRKKPGPEQFKKKRFEAKDPLVESQVMICDDLMEPSFHNYVTVRRGTAGVRNVEEQESSGSNSFAGTQQHWVSSSLLEHNSADSIEPGRRLAEKERESDQQWDGIGRGRLGSGRGLHSIPPSLAAAST